MIHEHINAEGLKRELERFEQSERRATDWWKLSDADRRAYAHMDLDEATEILGVELRRRLIVLRWNTEKVISGWLPEWLPKN